MKMDNEVQFLYLEVQKLYLEVQKLYLDLFLAKMAKLG